MELSKTDRNYGWFPYWRCWLKEENSIFALDSELNNLWIVCLSKASHKEAKWYYIVKGKGKDRLNLINDTDRYYYRNNFQFIGWVLPGRTN